MSRKSKDTAERTIEKLQSAGADKAVVALQLGEQTELNLEGGKLTLLRSTFETNLSMIALVGTRKGTTRINNLEDDSIDSGVENVLDLARSSEEDPANEIAGHQPAATFSRGAEAPDRDTMYDRMREFLEEEKRRYPDTMLEQSVLRFNASQRFFLNSNGVDFETRIGRYGFHAMFTTKKGKKSSSFNFSSFSAEDLEKPILEHGNVGTALGQNAGQVETTPVSGKFTGHIIVTPDCLMSILGFVTGQISDYPIITGTSVYKDRLGDRIASDVLTLHSRPVSDEIVDGYFITGDGYPAKNSTIIDNGVLRTFLLSLYGSRKTGGERAINSGGCYVVDPGDSSYDDLLRSVDKGLLVCRFSGGRPSSNGDFSGVAKNSYLIEDGEVSHPVSETMISGNLVTLLQNITGVSAERVDFGSSILPWLRFSGVTISSK